MIPGISSCPFSCSLDLYYYATWLRGDDAPQSASAKQIPDSRPDSQLAGDGPLDVTPTISNCVARSRVAPCNE